MTSEAARDRQVARETVRHRADCHHCNPGGPTMSTTRDGLRFGQITPTPTEDTAARLVSYTATGQARMTDLTDEDLFVILDQVTTAIRERRKVHAQRPRSWSPGDRVWMPADRGAVEALVEEVYDSGRVRCSYQHDHPDGPFYMTVGAAELRHRA